MEYKFFDKRFLVFPDQDCLGKRVFYSDTYKNLIEEVESGDLDRTSTLDGVHKHVIYPFRIDDNNWVLAYHDPNYEAKVAYSQGKQIQYKEADGKWVDITPHWVTGGEYRVRPEGTETRRYTNRELAEWVADNRGQILKNRMVSVSYYYLEGSDNAPVPGNVKIRAWSESEWHEPLVEAKE